LGNLARADRIFFSPVGKPVLSDPSDEFSDYVAPAPLESNVVPSMTLSVGETASINVWITLDNAPTNKSYLAVALDMDSSNPAVAHATGYEIFNPEIRGTDDGDPETPPFTRWDGIVPGAIGTAGSAKWVTNAAGLRVLQPGIGNNINTYADDPGRSRGATTTVPRSFFLGTLTFQADAAGQAGIYFRTGSSLSTLSPTAAPAQLQYGANAETYQGDVLGSGDPMSGDLALADLIINVEGPPPPSRDALRFNADAVVGPGAIVIPGPTGINRSVNVEVNSNAGVIVAQNFQGSFFDVFMEIDLADGVDPVAALAALVAQGSNGEPSDGYQVIPLLDSTNELGLGIDYDILVRYPVTPGQDAVIDFDFGTTATVRNVGIPEPSTFVLAAMGAVALLGMRRRRVR
jgi:hypothetical protein